MELELIGLAFAAVLFVFGSAISRLVKVKTTSIVIRELDNIGKPTLDDTLDEYIDSLLKAKIGK